MEQLGRKVTRPTSHHLYQIVAVGHAGIDYTVHDVDVQGFSLLVVQLLAFLTVDKQSWQMQTRLHSF